MVVVGAAVVVGASLAVGAAVVSGTEDGVVDEVNAPSTSVTEPSPASSEA